MSKSLRSVWLAVLVVALLGGLLALVHKTQAVDTTLRQQVNTQLSDLKQMDAEWNLDVLRSKIGINQNYDRVTTPLQWLQDKQAAIAQAVAQADAESIKTAADGLHGAIDTKITLIDRFKTQHSLLRNSLHFLPTAVAQLREQIGKTSAPANAGKANTNDKEADTTPSGDGNNKHKRELAKLEANTNEMLTELLKYNLTPDTGLRARVDGLISDLETHQPTYARLVSEQLGMIINHARTILKQQANEDKVLADIDQIPMAASINTLGERFEHGFDTALKAQDTWRGALVAYSGGLLLLLSFMGISLWRSYRSLDQANASLEQRVAERTHDLSVAMTGLKESQLQLVQSEKMASLGQMVAGIAHEINTPLAYVKSGLEILSTRMEDVDTLIHETTGLMALMTQEDGGDEEALAGKFTAVHEITTAFAETEVVGEVKGLLGDGLHGIAQITEIVRNLKDFSRLDRARITQFNVNDGIISTLNIARNVVKHRRIEQQLGDVPTITCSPSQINQVFLNLINNACQATDDENGTVTIVTRRTPDGVAIDIKDNGKGIPPDVLPKIFDPFFTTKKVGEGTGLGLSIVQRIIKAHGGEVKAVSTLNVGSCFTVSLPLNANANTAP